MSTTSVGPCKLIRLPSTLPLLQDAREDLAAVELAVTQLQAQLDALAAAGEVTAEVAGQMEEAMQALEVLRAICCTCLEVSAKLRLSLNVIGSFACFCPRVAGEAV